MKHERSCEGDVNINLDVLSPISISSSVDIVAFAFLCTSFVPLPLVVSFSGEENR